MRFSQTGRRQTSNEVTSQLGLIPVVAIAATTAIYSRGRLANIVGSQGGAAKSRADIVNAGSG